MKSRRNGFGSLKDFKWPVIYVSSQAIQVNTIIYCMGYDADNMLRGQPLSDVQQQKKITYNRARFNQRVRQPNESSDNFITLTEKCNATMELCMISAQR